MNGEQMNNLTHNEIIARLCQAGYPTFLVGGAVRDFFAGFDPADYDIVTKATPNQIAEVFTDVEVGTFGKSFGVTLVDGTDVATFRQDHYPNGDGAKNCVVKYADTIHEDLSRRDLTVNALAICSLSGELIDDHEGLEDLRRSVIRFVGDAELRIREDPNRIVRAARFVAKLGGTFAPDTLAAIKRNAHLVGSRVDPERIGIEVLKAMEVNTPSLFFSALLLTGVLPYVFPGMEDCANHEHGVHHQEDVWEHSMLAGDKVSAKFPLVRLAAFLHDVGKPGAFAQNNDGSFVGHEVRGFDLVNGWLAALKFSNVDRSVVAGLVKSHMWGGSSDITPKAIRKLLFKLSELGITKQEWLRVRIADRHANLLRDDFTYSEIKERALKIGVGRPLVEVIPFSVNDLALKGGELIALFNLKPSAVVGELQRYLLALVIEHGEEYNTKEVLQEQAALFLEKQ